MRVTTPPGEVLKEEFMEPLGLSANMLARQLDVPPNRITAIINGTRSVTSDTALRLAQAFAAPVTLTSRMREGSLRATATQAGVTVLLFEAGEGLRVDETAVRIGIAGILRTMAAIGMLPASAAPRIRAATVHCQKSDWLRAPGAGLMTPMAEVGDRVTAGAVLATISDPFGETEVELVSPKAGILVGRAHLPLVNEGDALFHLAELPQADTARDQVLDIPDEDELI